jgi:hypothetical protein
LNTVAKLVFQNDVSYLSNLIRLRLLSRTLEVRPFRDSVFSKHMVAPLDPAFKSKPLEQSTQIVEFDIRVTRTPKDLLAQTCPPAHPLTLAEALARFNAPFHRTDGTE